MGQKVNPNVFRVCARFDWNSRWFANRYSFPVFLKEDIKLRRILKDKLRRTAVGRVMIERTPKLIKIVVHSSKPGTIIGKKGGDIDALKTEAKLLAQTPVNISVEEISKPDLDARLVAENISEQLEKRVSVKRIIKRVVSGAIRQGALGIKVMCAGRLGGAEIARKEWYKEGKIPLQTLNADIDYATSKAKTTYGSIGVKVWIYKGSLKECSYVTT
ncbi:30S ribosomal protein S3 [Candidatus Tremblaya phenacola]|uniref:Small ribosomal subunit protein uS3 n=1 Tax=Candidatus Tremblayella phenacoccinincola TaxID=1010676 RepID=A0A2G0V6W9_9PROT|nr:30S ribosomal protein S3 [Candidatus Tremblaya phenacola]PHN16209.1 30S ribosomal protein S3 [Candidatus Tremblaya phenacola]